MHHVDDPCDECLVKTVCNEICVYKIEIGIETWNKFETYKKCVCCGNKHFCVHKLSDSQAYILTCYRCNKVFTYNKISYNKNITPILVYSKSLKKETLDELKKPSGSFKLKSYFVYPPLTGDTTVRRLVKNLKENGVFI